MKKTLPICLLALLAACAQPQTSSYDSTATASVEETRPLTIEEQRALLAKREAEDWSNQLVTDFQYRSNLINETVVEGTITNNATAVQFRDFELNVTWYAKTGTPLKSTRKTVYEAVPPGQSVPIKIKLPTPADASTVGAEIVNVSNLY